MTEITSKKDLCKQSIPRRFHSILTVLTESPFSDFFSNSTVLNIGKDLYLRFQSLAPLSAPPAILGGILNGSYI